MSDTLEIENTMPLSEGATKFFDYLKTFYGCEVKRLADENEFFKNKMNSQTDKITLEEIMDHISYSLGNLESWNKLEPELKDAFIKQILNGVTAALDGKKL
jgi:hypothetical protein